MLSMLSLSLPSSHRSRSCCQPTVKALSGYSGYFLRTQDILYRIQTKNVVVLNNWLECWKYIESNLKFCKFSFFISFNCHNAVSALNYKSNCKVFEIMAQKESRLNFSFKDNCFIFCDQIETAKECWDVKNHWKHRFLVSNTKYPRDPRIS